MIKQTIASSPAVVRRRARWLLQRSRSWLLAHPRKVQILYDRSLPGQPYFSHGRVVAQMLQNLLGHFPHLQQVVLPIDQYVKGSIDASAATFYLGALHGNPVPEAFLADYAEAAAPAVWLNYNVWQLGAARLEHSLSARFGGLVRAELDRLDDRGMPGFFRTFQYRGETFFKRAPAGNGSLEAASEAVILHPLPNTDRNAVCWMRHSSRDLYAPYVLRNEMRWYVADLPFTCLHEEDRYLIFADLLFDMLREPPARCDRRLALVRFEDVHPALPQWQLDSMLRFACEARIPFAVSIIPHFKDPQGVLASDAGQRSVTMLDRPSFVRWTRHAERHGASLLLHGCTHQRDDPPNPYGVSGLDSEFWDAVLDQPLRGDCASGVLERLEDGVAHMSAVGSRPVAWVTPHYAASPLANVVLGQTFEWSLGRATYAPIRVSQSQRIPADLTFDRAGTTGRAERMSLVDDLRVEYLAGECMPSGQFFPFEIHGDVHAARIVPETVGYLRPGEFGVDDMLRIMRRNRCLRDIWGSFYLHPQLVGHRDDGGLGRFEGDTRDLAELIHEVKALGYEFIDLTRWIRRNARPLRPDPIES